MRKNILLTNDDFGLFQKLFIEKSGLYFDRDRKEGLNIALSERLKEHGFDNYLDYYNFLQYDIGGDEEFHKLLNLVTIGETYFFRNQPQIDALINFVLPEIANKKSRDVYKKIRIWSAGCSRGDEPYSIAIAIMETIPDYKLWDISILGTDINENAISASKAALYSGKDIEFTPKAYLEKYFKKIDMGYTVRDEVRKMVKFRYHNMACEPFDLEDMADLDIIFCRNVTIYFNFKVIKNVVEKFHSSLNDDGYLFMGHAETLWQITDKFTAIEFPKTFIYKKTLHPELVGQGKPFMAIPDIKLESFWSAPPFVTTGEVIEPEDAETEGPAMVCEEAKENVTPDEEPPRESPEMDKLYSEAIDLFNKKDFDGSLKIFDRIIGMNANATRAYFFKSNILANQARYEEAVNELEMIIEADNLYIEAYYLLGVLLYKTGNFDGAEKQFRKVIYIDPEVVLAYFNLGNIYLYEKKKQRALREFSNAIKILKKRPKDSNIKFCEDFNAEFLLRACRERLEVI